MAAPPTAPIANPDAKACSSGVQPFNSSIDVTTPIETIDFIFILNPLYNIKGYNKIVYLLWNY
jgi:hypothetical protein